MFDAHTLFTLIVGVVCTIVALRSVQATDRPAARLWALVNAFVAVVAAVSVWLIPEWSAAITLGFALPLIVLPTVLSQLSRQRMEADDPVGALRLSRLLVRVHPTAETREVAAVYAAAVATETAGDTSALVDLVRSGSPRQRLWAAVTLGLEEQRWSDVLDIVHREVPSLAGMAGPCIRALSRLGRNDEMVALYEEHQSRMDAREPAMCRLYMLSALGREQGVSMLLDGPLRNVHPDAASLVRAVTRLRTEPGDAAARQVVADLAISARPRRLRVAAAQALIETPPAPRVSARVSAAVQAMEQAIADEAIVRPHPPLAGWLTLVLIAINLVVFAFTIAYDALEDARRIVRFGALWTPAVYIGGEWWRLVTAMFLHGGVLHVALNMFVLFEVGRLIERLLGRLSFLVIYFVSGAGAFLVITLLAEYGYIDDALVVGASGAIFGLIGGFTAVLAVLRLRTGARLYLRHLMRIGVLLVAQLLFDVMVPESSLLGHASGFVIGVLVGLPLAVLNAPVSPVTARTPAVTPSST